MKTVMLEARGKRVRVELETAEFEGNKRIFASYPFCLELKDEMKETMEGARWQPAPGGAKGGRWHFDNSHHNHFRLQYLMGHDPYQPYDAPLKEVVSTRPLMNHQLLMKSVGLTRHQCIWAAQPGTGKSLSGIEVAEELHKEPLILDHHGQPITRRYFWVAPKAALLSVQLECIKWKTKIPWEFMTYEKMVSIIANWKSGDAPPQLVLDDEASRLKNPKAERSKSAKYLADAMRDRYGRDAYVILMSGTPAPQSPLDWYSLMSIAVPGYLKEKSWWNFRETLCLVKEEEALHGGSYPKIVTWYDSETKCKQCGQVEEDIVHTAARHPEFHKYKACTNEVARLYERMKGAVVVILKKDCLDLPEKVFIRRQAVIPQSMLRAAKMIPATLGTGAKALTVLRELSDGFQYQKYVNGETECDLCCGKGTIDDMIYTGPESDDTFLISLGLIPGIDIVDPVRFPDLFHLKHVKCSKCKGTQKIPTFGTEAKYVGSPKDPLMNEIFEEYDELGRLVVYGAFQASIDNIVKLAENNKWDWIKADGRSWASSMGGNPMSWLSDFQNPDSLTKRLVFIGQPEAAGMGLTLTRACAAVFYSNSFNGESRLQAIERIHRPGASKELGVTIIDLIGLPTDGYVLDKLAAKEDLQAITLGSLEKCLEEAHVEE